MWTLNDEMRAVAIDLETQVLSWFDQIGCHCGDTTETQAGAAYLQDGPPPFIGPLPADVAAELKAMISRRIG
jgi:hypothetical protein